MAPPTAFDVRPAGQVQPTDLRASYVDSVLSFIDGAALAPLCLVADAGNRAAGPTFDAIAAALALRGAKLDICLVNHTPDKSFPNGIPNPLLPESHAATGDAVRAVKADLGVAWDGDFDRCFLFD